MRSVRVLIIVCLSVSGHLVSVAAGAIAAAVNDWRRRMEGVITQKLNESDVGRR